MTELIFGRLTLEAFKHDFVQMGAIFMMIIGAITATVLVFYYQGWTHLWKEWVTTVDHKKIGIMYLVVSSLMLFKGAVDGAMIRLQQMFSVGDHFGYLSSDHFQQVFTAHGVTMIFFVATGFLFGIINYILPLQIGARDVAFPFLNNLSFWFFAVGNLLMVLSMVIGDFAQTGWVAYPTLSELEYSAGEGVDYWIWSIQISGIGTLLSGINFLVTIFTMRAPGMSLMKMPVFVWTTAASMVLVIFAFPILTSVVGMLTLDRMLGMHFFTSDAGGNLMLYVNWIWAWGHPEVYILVLPAFGIFSEVVSTFCQKRLFGYVTMVWATVAIVLLAFIVWLHHFFTMGAGPSVNAFFGIMTMLISIPTGVKIFNWLFTMYQGRIKFTPPILLFLGFIVIFGSGGATGVMMAVAPIDFQVHNSLFLIAHFHSMVIGGVLFGILAGLYYWFPKMFGFKLVDRFGSAAVYCWTFGFLLAFMPLYALGFMGATRRLDHYEADTGWQPLFIVASIGVAIIFLGVALQVLHLIVSVIERKKNMDTTGNPWNAGTLEWSTVSPPPPYNFAVIPHVDDLYPLWEGHKKHEKPVYHSFHMPKNTGLGFFIGGFSFLFSWGAIWQMYWLLPVGIIGTLVCLILRLADRHTEHTLSPSEIEITELLCQKK